MAAKELPWTFDREWNCASCHGAVQVQSGRHAATGKRIAAPAPAAAPQRFTYRGKVEKWFPDLQRRRRPRVHGRREGGLGSPRLRAPPEDRITRSGWFVRDAPVRVFHWLTVACFPGARLTSESERLRLVHVTLGYTTAGLVR